MSSYEEIQAAASTLVRGIAPIVPRIGVVLGSGLGAFADVLANAKQLSYAEVPGLAESSVAGHSGRFVAGMSGRVPVLVMQGRVHLYEGHSASRVVLPIRAMIAAGCRVVIVTNAAGGVAERLAIGDLALITDHVNMTGCSPLVGVNDDRIGPRFPDMTVAYDPELRVIAHQQAQAEGITLREGVYCSMLGPTYETPAEIRMLRAMGIDLVGMSTVPEVIAARHMGARVLGISCVTNLAAGMGAVLSHDDVARAGAEVSARFVALLSRVIATVN